MAEEKTTNFTYQGRRLFSFIEGPLERAVVFEGFDALETLVKLPTDAVLETDKAAIEYGDIRSEIFLTTTLIYLSHTAYSADAETKKRAMQSA